MPSTCERIFIDDHCDACGHKDRLGVTFGLDKAVICFECVEAAMGVVTASRLIYDLPPLSGDTRSSNARKG
jgi:hypothetical protein